MAQMDQMQGGSKDRRLEQAQKHPEPTIAQLLNHEVQATAAADHKVLWCTNHSAVDAHNILPALTIDDFYKNAQTDLAKFDTNNDGYLSKQEIAQAIDNPKYSGKDTYNLVALDELAGLLRKAELAKADSIKGAIKVDHIGTDLQELRASRKVTDGDSVDDLVKDSMQAVEAYYRRNNNTDLYNDCSTPLESIKPDAIRQGNSGDCYFESAVAGLALAKPEAIRDMILELPNDGGYMVTFPGEPDKPIFVAKPSDADMVLYNHPRNLGTWANVLELAYGKLQAEKAGEGDAPTKPLAEYLHGGALTEGIRVLTGHDAEFLETKLFKPVKTKDRAVAEYLDKRHHELLDERIDEALQHQRLIEVSTNNPSAAGLKAGLVPQHAYTLLGSHIENGELVYDLRNPHGMSGPRGSNFSVSYKELYTEFDAVVFEGAQKAGQ